MFTSIASAALLLTVPFSSVKEEKRIKLIPSGENIVFKMNSKGIVVTGTYDVEYGAGIYNPATHSDIRQGDIIVKANQKEIVSIEDLSEEISAQDSVELTIERDQRELRKTLKIYQVNQISRSGLYVKDKVIGVGTLSYIDPSNLYYGALGHEVIDNDTKELATLSAGDIYYNDVISVTKGTNHNPGEKISQTKLENAIGDIAVNSDKGMFGKYSGDISGKKAYEIAYQDEVKKGKAQILTCTKGSEVVAYDIEITALKSQKLDETKGITFKITDRDLLSKAGGVYSGMSGSPIIQNDRLIGAVTHVLVDKIEYGYGLYIENMYNQESRLTNA